jgi:hypothetical protein
LSIDEIWSDERPAFPDTSNSPAAAHTVEEDEEETITFDAPEDVAFPGAPVTDANAPFTSNSKKEPKDSSTGSAEATDGAVDFEMVPEADADVSGEDDAGGGGGEDLADYELDELEAEIARELED